MNDATRSRPGPPNGSSGDAGGHLLDGFPIVIRLPVQWGEMDAYGHVNNTVFFRFFESARIVYLDRCGFIASYERDKVGAILHSTSCRFRLPLRYPDTILIGARATEVREDRFMMEYKIVSQREEAVAAEGTGLVVAFDYAAGRKTALPAPVRHHLEELESRS